MHLPFWLTTAGLSPVLIYQGKQARRNTVRLPEASGEPFGQYGEGIPERRVLVIGESTAAGVGVQTHNQGLASQLARRLHERTGRVTEWHTFGINGATLAELMAQLDIDTLPEADLVLLSMGVNDTTALTPRSRFRQQLVTLGEQLRNRYDSPLGLLSVPPMHRFTALPSPLRQVMGWRARQLDGVYRALARTQPEAFVHLGYPAVTDAGLLAADGYHPGESGYRLMGETLAELVDQ
ncbi:SGNH/GDSL hydrolase family protein [Marinobacter sp. AN1]|uniref:SGNH/GDSL hydrolase family protein n=1 Tax=Marinobacter sp. AN1 TaxID=2886046 RepID=UPI00223019F6|nr:SGNH/GDSL hydrolase family protein [Marinobacter sp. AN1]UZD65719.1 SGNH/GDSL hydrolase family protein [Marinobacter sp. AN1]